MKKIYLLIGFLALTVGCNVGTSTPASAPSPTATLQPTLAPATSTSTFIPASTSTSPAPTAAPIYFTEEFETASTFWEFIQTGGTTVPTTAFENGSLRIDISAPHTWYLGLYNAQFYSNSFITAKSTATPAGSVGLICRYDPSKGWFEFNIASDGTYSVLFGQWLAPDIAQYAPIVSGSTNLLAAGNLNYEIGLACQDNSLMLYINGTLLRRVDVERYELSAGKFGITASSFKEIPMTAFFEWIKVDEQ